MWVWRRGSAVGEPVHTWCMRLSIRGASVFKMLQQFCTVVET
jgi:hypothetical protein